MRSLVCQKKTMFRCLLSVFVSALGLCFALSSDVSAYNFGTVSSGYFGSSTSITTPTPVPSRASRVHIYWNPQNGQKIYYPTGTDWSGARQLVLTNNNPSAGSLKEIELIIPEYTSIPAGSLFHFSIRYSSASLTATNSTYNGASAEGWTLLNSSCTPYSQTQNAGAPTYTQYTGILCDYYGYTEETLNNVRLVGNIFTFPIDGLVLIIQPYDYVKIEDETGGSIDISGLSNNVQLILDTLRQNNIINADIYYDVEDIKDLLEELSTTGSLSPTAIENAIENAKENERQELEDAVDEAQSEADSSGARSQAQGQSLLQILTGFVSAISSPTGDNCIIDVDLSLYQGGTHNNVDLCRLSPPAGITAILSIILIVFVISATIHVVNAMINLYREFQS